MPNAAYCDVALPIPVSRLFTYSLPLTLQHRVKAGCRVLVPFGSRNLTGVVLREHNNPPTQEVRPASKLLDEEPVLDAELLRLGQWIAEYYCAPIGEVLKGMLPLGGETRRSVLYSLTEPGRDVARQLTATSNADASVSLLRLLEARPRSLAYLSAKVDGAKAVLKSLMKRGWVDAEERSEDRDPFRASAERLEVEFSTRPAPDLKLKKSERELIAFLELHPGPHNLAEVSEKVAKASEAARSLARRELIKLAVEAMRPSFQYGVDAPVLNSFQAAAFFEDQGSSAGRCLQTVLTAGRHRFRQNGSLFEKH